MINEISYENIFWIKDKNEYINKLYKAILQTETILDIFGLERLAN